VLHGEAQTQSKHITQICTHILQSNNTGIKVQKLVPSLTY